MRSRALKVDYRVMPYLFKFYGKGKTLYLYMKIQGNRPNNKKNAHWYKIFHQIFGGIKYYTYLCIVLQETSVH